MRRALTTIAVIAAVAILAVVACKERNAKTTVDVASVNKDIREHLPIGSSRLDVEAFLDQRQIGHTHIGELKDSPENRHTEIALIRGVSQSLLVRGDIQILFKFDETDSKLISYKIQEVFTGP